MPFGLLKRFWQSRPARAAVGAFVLAVVFAALYRLAYSPLPSVDVGKKERFSPAVVNLGQEELVIEEPEVNSPGGVLFSHEGQENEVVNVYFVNARLDDVTVEDFFPGPKPPPASGTISYTTPELEQTPEAGVPCRTFFSVEVNDDKPPRALHFFQKETAGANRRRELEMKTGGAELVVRIHTSSPPGATTDRQDCHKWLRVGNLKPLSLSASSDVRVIAAADSTFRFTFSPLDPNAKPVWDGGAEGFYAPVEFEPSADANDPLPLRVRAVNIELHNANPDSPPAVSARSVDAALLRVYDLKVGSDKLQLKVSGKGKVSTDGQEETADRLKWVEDRPVLAGVLVSILLSLIAWFGSLLRPAKGAPPVAQ